MTQQEAFDRNWQHFVVEQKPKRADAKGKCYYHRDDGNCCGVGLLLSPGLRGRLTNSLTPLDELPGLIESEAPEFSSEWEELVSTLGFYFLEDLQTKHDGVQYDPEKVTENELYAVPEVVQFRERLTALANDYKLTIPA